MKEKTVLGLIVLLGLVSAQQIVVIPNPPVAGLPVIATLDDLSNVRSIDWTVTSFRYWLYWYWDTGSSVILYNTFPGQYTITANITYTDGTTKVISKDILINMPANSSYSNFLSQLQTIPTLQNQISTLQSQANQLNNSISLLNQTVSSNITSIDANIANLSNLFNNSIQALQSQLNSQQQALNVVSGKTTNLENTINQVNLNLNNYTAQMQAQILPLQNSINQLTNDTQTTFQYLKAQNTVNLIFFVIAIVNTILTIFLLYKISVIEGKIKKREVLKDNFKR